MRSRLGAVLAATVLSVLVLVAPAHAALPGANGKIAFTSGGDIWTVEPDGTGATDLTNSAAYDKDPSWSQDGSKIAFVTDRDATRPCGQSPIQPPPCNDEIY